MRAIAVAVGGVALFVIGLVMVGNALSVLIYSGAMSAILFAMSGEKFLGTVGLHVILLIVGAVISFAGVGVFVAAFNLRRNGPGSGRSNE